MTGLGRRQHFIEILVSKPDWDTFGVPFRELVLDPLGQAVGAIQVVVEVHHERAKIVTIDKLVAGRAECDREPLFVYL